VTGRGQSPAKPIATTRLAQPPETPANKTVEQYHKTPLAQARQLNSHNKQNIKSPIKTAPIPIKPVATNKPFQGKPRARIINNVIMNYDLKPNTT